MQIATVAVDLPEEEKLTKLYRFCSQHAMRALQQDDNNEDEDEEKVYDLIQDLVATLRKGPSGQEERRKTEFFRSLGARVKDLQSSSAAATSDRALPPRVRQVRDYAAKLDAESEEWRAMLNARQERYRKARADKLAVLKGARKLTEAEDARHLAPEVRQMLESAPDGVAHAARLVELEQRLGEKERAVASAVAESRRMADAVRRRNDSLVKRVAAIGEHLDKREVAGAADGNDSGIDSFLSEVDRWMMEIKQ